MKPVKTDIQFPVMEKAVFDFWKQNGIIEKGLAANQGADTFVFYDGPPFATGLPHYGHILAGTLKDIVPRYWVMKGKHVQRRWGWDCHGLPVEYEMEKELGLNSRQDIEKMGIAKFNESCRGIVTRYTKEWEEVINRTGRWADFRNNYRTMDTPFMETVWWVVKQLWDKGLIYEGYRVMPYSWRISTPLSNFEASLNYKEVQDPALTVRFKSLKHPRYLLAWTTTPWTLPANLALAVNETVTYVEIEESESKQRYVLSKSRLGAYYKTADQYKILGEFSGKALEGETYEPLLPYYKDKAKEGAFRVVLGEHVTDTDGTGIVHTAPAHGEDDFIVAQKYGVPLVDATDALGNFTSAVPELAGINIKEAEKLIIKMLKEKGAIVRHDTIVHNYAFCWRSDTPLMNKAISTWFVRLDPIKKQLIENNQKTHWVPEHIRDGRFGNWLENARDWNISRNRFWGTPIPVWRCSAPCNEMVCIGSIAELEKLYGKKLADIHKQFVDQVTFPCPKCGKHMKRIPEVLDCWFESGSMPYGQAHYPFENKERFEKNFPADFIAEGIDQTRGWFYTLSVLSTALFNKPPFKHVIVNGLVLAEDGKKMSKRLKNYPDPSYLMDTYGADAMRAYLMNSPASHADDLRFSEAGVKEIVRSVLLPFWNAYSFFVTYAIADGWEAASFQEKNLDKLEDETDRWVVSRLQSLIRAMDEKMAEYHLYEVVPEVIAFIDQLTNWYIRLNRRRFWSDEKNKDKESAYQTLYFTLTTFNRVLAPILPFVTDEIYQNLEAAMGKPESVHLARFPEIRPKWIDTKLERDFALVQSVVFMGRNLRSVHKLKTRQPLKELLVITRDEGDRKVVEKYQQIIAQELNVKKVGFSADVSKYATYRIKPNFKELGRKFGSNTQVAAKKISAFSAEEIAKALAAGNLTLDGEILLAGTHYGLECVPKGKGVIESQGSLTVWLDSEVTQELVDEGRAREFVNRVQKLRKESNFNVTDRIRVQFEGQGELRSAIEKHASYIKDETLASELVASSRSQWAQEDEIDNLTLKLWVERV